MLLFFVSVVPTSHLPASLADPQGPSEGRGVTIYISDRPICLPFSRVPASPACVTRSALCKPSQRGGCRNIRSGRVTRSTHKPLRRHRHRGRAGEPLTLLGFSPAGCYLFHTVTGMGGSGQSERAAVLSSAGRLCVPPSSSVSLRARCPSAGCLVAIWGPLGRGWGVPAPTQLHLPQERGTFCVGLSLAPFGGVGPPRPNCPQGLLSGLGRTEARPGETRLPVIKRLRCLSRFPSYPRSARRLPVPFSTRYVCAPKAAAFPGET